MEESPNHRLQANKINTTYSLPAADDISNTPHYINTGENSLATLHPACAERIVDGPTEAPNPSDVVPPLAASILQRCSFNQNASEINSNVEDYQVAVSDASSAGVFVTI